MLLSILHAEPLDAYRIALTFNNQHRVVVDFAPFLFHSPHPDYVIYQDRAHFLRFQLLDGNLNWDDYRMIFPIEDLYHQRLIPS
ncbi:DUF2442 domain-containing protein [Marinospirillum sp. MEB164]|uniref:DUF2442 domain-containing protein n=1 Tax=Marinospirillum alkalitolerans TaxID=3123374 RepID=A0ABW8PXV4_9GAMM